MSADRERGESGNPRRVLSWRRSGPDACRWLLKLRAGLFVALLAVSLRAQDEAPLGPRLARCRLAYAYDARTGFLTCLAGARYWTFYPHESARRARHLPAGSVLVVEYAIARGCGAGCWIRILAIER